MNFSKLRSDLPASIVVFLVALPLCLGVALASGAPLISGVISGIIGGLIVGILSGSHTSVSGPAAGLAAVVLASITQLGGFELFLTAVLIAGVIQLIMGITKMGFIADYIPSNVIKGLLAAIGIILIIKQIPHAIGYDKDPEEDFSFWQTDGDNTFSALFHAFSYITPGALVISVLSMAVLILWDKTPLRQFKFLPSALFVVVLGVALNALFGSYVPYLAIEPSHLVNIPRIDLQNLGGLLHLPDLSHLTNPVIWKVAFTVAIIASLETLLNIEAVDKLDTHRRQTPPNTELIAQGVGNIAAGLLGGIPVTSVIVRSSVNIQSGNETKLSAILHGVFMLLSVLLLSPIINLIPLSSLAAILIITGYKLANVSLFKNMYSKGWEQFIPFVATIIAIVFTDLLIGVLLGLALSIFFIMRHNYQTPFTQAIAQTHFGEVMRLELNNQVSFINKASIKNTLWAVPEEAKVIVDATYANYIDPDVLEIIEDFKSIKAPESNIQLNVVGLKDVYQKDNDYIQFVNVIDQATQQRLTPAEILAMLKAGNKRFVEGVVAEKYYKQQLKVTAAGQNPLTVIVGCIDSRTSPEILFDAGLGDLLSVRIAGNIINTEIIESIELAVSKLGAKLVVIKGHSSCGAVANAVAYPNESNLTLKIGRAVTQCNHQHHLSSKDTTAPLSEIIQQNVQNSLQDVLQNSTYLRQRVQQGDIAFIGAFHNIETGEVHFDPKMATA